MIELFNAMLSGILGVKTKNDFILKYKVFVFGKTQLLISFSYFKKKYNFGIYTSFYRNSIIHTKDKVYRGIHLDFGISFFASISLKIGYGIKDITGKCEHICCWTRKEEQ